MLITRRSLFTMLVLAPALQLAGCEDLVLFGGDVEIRMRNASTYTLLDVRVEFPGGLVIYGDIDAGRSTSYRVVERAYGYAYVEAIVDGRTLRLVPIDHVGEDYLKAGSYTYELGVYGDAQSLTHRLVRD